MSHDGLSSELKVLKECVKKVLSWPPCLVIALSTK